MVAAKMGVIEVIYQITYPNCVYYATNARKRTVKCIRFTYERCFFEDEQGYLVYYDLFHIEKADAEEVAKTYRRLLKKKGFDNHKISVYRIEVGG